MIIEYIKSKVQDSCGLLLYILAFCVIFHLAINVVLGFVIKFAKLPIKQFSLGPIIGTSLRSLSIATDGFKLKVGNISVKLFPIPLITLQSVQLEILKSKTHVNNMSKIPMVDSKEKFFIPTYIKLNETAFKILKWLLPASIYFRFITIKLPNNTTITSDILSIKVTKFTEHHLVMEVFLNNVLENDTGNTIKLVGFELQSKIHQSKVDKCFTVNVNEWNTFLKIFDLNISIPETIVKNLMKTSNQTSALHQAEAKTDLSSLDMNEIGKLLKKAVCPYKGFLKTLKIFDIKFENLTFSYKDKVSLAISSSQVYLESVLNSNYGATLESIPITGHTLGDYEFSFSATAISLKVNRITSLRLPLINIVITTDIMLFLFEDIPLCHTKVAYNTNFINPSIFLSVDQILEGLDILNRISKKSSKESNLTLAKHDTPVDGNHILETFNPSDIFDKIPSFIFELSISNFNLTLQVSPTDSVMFKVYASYALFNHRNITQKRPSTTLKIFKNISEFPLLDGATEQINDYLKIIGVNVTFKSTDSDITKYFPIYEFERADTFFGNWSTPQIDIQSTLRRSNFILNDINVLDKLHSSILKISEAYTFKRSGHGPSSSSGTSFMKSLYVDWSVRLRIKNLTCSLLVASYLPKYLDPLDINGFNLTDVTRGVIIKVDESILLASRKNKSFDIVQASLVRIMDDINHTSVQDDLVKFEDFLVSFDEFKNTSITLPRIFLKVDVNLFWLSFFFKAIFRSYKQKNVSLRGESKDQNSKDNSNELQLKIGRIILELDLPQDTPLLFVFREIQYSKSNNEFYIQSISGYVHSVYVEQLTIHIPLLTIKKLRINLKENKDMGRFNVKTSEINLRTEYHFKIYMILSSIVTTYKSIKQLNYSFSDLSEFNRYYPKESKPVKIPEINLVADRFMIQVEDDPFEQELGLILKVGILEQRERLQKLKEFEEQKHNIQNGVDNSLLSPPPSAINNDFINNITDELELQNEALERLYENFSTSWIARYRKAKLTFHGMPHQIKTYEELGQTYHRFTGNQIITVATLTVEKLDMTLKPPSFELDKYPEFIHKYGNGVPKTQLYTVLLCLGIDIRTMLWQLKLRDYPIPIVTFPDTHTTGNVVFAEKMPGNHSLRSTYVPFVPSTAAEAYTGGNSIYGSHVIGTVNAIKTYFDINTNVMSSNSSSITWGKSLQPGYQALMQWFDFLTKPQLDPSPRLGFWDKFRYLAHGSWTYHFSENSNFLLNVKGSHDPYKIADDGAGLSFCWTGGTVVKIHGNDKPEDFLVIESKKFQLAVPDFTTTDKFDKTLMKLDGKVTWKMGMLFEQGDLNNPGDEKRFKPNRPHYDVNLINPEYVFNREEYDSWNGFRSDFIHMSFGVYSSHKGSKNSLYLAPYSIGHFLSWWNLFDTYTSGPIRQGSLFPHMIQNRNKFGRSLFTIKYQLNLAPLTVTHVYRHATAEDDNGIHSSATFTGLKGKIKSLRVDLHQKRIKLTHTNEKLNRSKPVWKLRMSLGEIDCQEADVRIISTVFDEAAIEKTLASRLGLRCRDQATSYDKVSEDVYFYDWYDFEDYVDLDQVSLQSTLPVKIETIPLLSSPRISYFRKMNDDGYYVKYPFGNEHSHSCIIGKNHPELTQEKLARERALSITKRIMELKSLIRNMDGSPEKHNNGKLYQEKLKTYHSELEELVARSEIIDKILSELKLSEDVPILNPTNKDDNNMEDISESESLNELGSLLRTNTVNSFVTMRRASTMAVKSTYDNKFLIHNVQLRLNKKIRNHLLEYASSSAERKSVSFFSTYKSILIAKELLCHSLSNVKTSITEYGLVEDTSFASNEEFIERFDELIRKVPNDNFDSIDSYLFQFISPQIQITSDVEPEAAILLTARDIEVGIIDVMQVMTQSGKTMEMDVNTIVESRYCTVSKDIQLFTLFRNEALTFNSCSNFRGHDYGLGEASSNWAPWVPLELCFDGSLMDEDIILRRRSLFLTYNSPNPLYFSENSSNNISTDSKFHLGFPSLVVTSTSQQYNTVYNIVEDMMSLDSSLDEKAEKLSKLLLADEVRNNLERIDISVVTNLQDKIKDLYHARAFLKSYEPTLYKTASQDLTLEIQATVLELSVLMTAIMRNYDRFGKENHVRKILNWKVGTDDLIWELYDENKSPFITIALGPSSFVRSQTVDGSNSNVVSIRSLQVFNQQKKVIYQQLVAPFEEHPNYSKDISMLEIFWLLGAPVGGISVLEEMIISFQPVLFRMDHITADKIMNYLFPKNSTSNSVKPRSISPPANPRKSNSSMHSLSAVKSGNKIIRDSQSIREPRRSTSNFIRQTDDSINVMVQRSGTYFIIKSVVIKKMLMSISYKGAHGLLTNVDDLTVKVPTLQFSNRLWSRDEFFAAVKKDINKVVLQHMGNIIGNKFVPHRKENRKKISTEIAKLLHSDSESVKSGSGSSHTTPTENIPVVILTPQEHMVNAIDSYDADGESIKPFYPLESSKEI
ncbi:hypothetical protein Kpol_1018p128 [Vanderwaltozyma polyspora DSM 70294]|uniref:Uncharacterized protein n=1 Tax=Vanderwaltozyma polyspora (strain ATCC 22028 / DSM 70294 / BCRC 21397 / CBS 2163 / NBRC 10782 / NRRL Y-8283 / UCD 57-17) TaxID=436907 RepID=A7TDX1_VANPO|nr:uncharacterized protein Kpol_1018p128 [Vanderwaltozyma polyspora DSM 70294]EDO19591.1 hypothetical protein Kpol_1018p128 [Vanderwaltozyma polyspora DSM 70294]